MFRNIYLEAYKSAFYSDTRLEVLMCHLANIYATLGCIVQDMEYMVGKVLFQNTTSNQPHLHNPQKEATQTDHRIRVSAPEKM